MNEFCVDLIRTQSGRYRAELRFADTGELLLRGSAARQAALHDISCWLNRVRGMLAGLEGAV